MPRLAENSQTCQILPATASGSLQLLHSTDDWAHRYKLAVQFLQSQAKLESDTSASGLYITRAVAVQNGLQRGVGDPEGTVHVDSVRIGAFEFRDCTVGVSDTRFTGHVDGTIGTDMFASYLVTIDYRSGRLTLSPLPPRPCLLPGDRFVPAELRGFVPVYHRRQFLLLPVAFKNGSRQLFVLGTAMPYTAMSSEAVRSVSDIKQNVTDSERTASGAKEQFYRAKFDFQLASLPLIQRRRILEFDFSDIDRQAGFQVAGVLGLEFCIRWLCISIIAMGWPSLNSGMKTSAPHQTNGTEHTSKIGEGIQ